MKDKVYDTWGRPNLAERFDDWRDRNLKTWHLVVLVVVCNVAATAILIYALFKA